LRKSARKIELVKDSDAHLATDEIVEDSEHSSTSNSNEDEIIPAQMQVLRG
jgi:hypothetical protein